METDGQTLVARVPTEAVTYKFGLALDPSRRKVHLLKSSGGALLVLSDQGWEKRVRTKTEFTPVSGRQLFGCDSCTPLHIAQFPQPFHNLLFILPSALSFSGMFQVLFPSRNIRRFLRRSLSTQRTVSLFV